MSIFGKKTEKSDKAKTRKPDTKSEPAKSAAPVSMKDLYGTETAAGDKAKEKTQKSTSSRAYRILIKPLVTEKASVLGTENKYAFAVAIDANKIEIAKAVKDIYGIKPLAVNVIRLEGKLTRSGRTKGQRKDWKKAIVTLPEGKTIQVYEGV